MSSRPVLPNAVRAGLQTAEPLDADTLKCADMNVKFSSKNIPIEKLKEYLPKKKQSFMRKELPMKIPNSGWRWSE
jgi:hypothetical protein